MTTISMCSLNAPRAPRSLRRVQLRGSAERLDSMLKPTYLGARNRKCQNFFKFSVRMDQYAPQIGNWGLTLTKFDEQDLQQGTMDLKQKMGNRDCTESEIEWFLRDRKLDTEKAEVKLNKFLDWRESGYNAIKASDPDVAKELESEKALLLDRCDKIGRPVVVINTELQNIYERDLEASKRHCVYLLDSALGDLQQSNSEVETVLCIFDLRGFGPNNADLPFLKFFVDVMFKYYPKRISQVLLIEPPFVFRPLWAAVKPLLGKYSSLVRNIKSRELDDYLGPGHGL